MLTDSPPVDTGHNLKLALTVVAFIAALLFGHPAVALLIGGAVSLSLSPVLPVSSKNIGKLSLQTAIVMLGFTLDTAELWSTSQSYAGMISAYVLMTLAVGLAVGHLLRVNVAQARLLASGTAICGGTAIATIAPVIRARATDVGVCLTAVFLLNAIAILFLPWVGHLLELTQTQFGVWAALAIHDTSSVVGAAAIYGDEALEVATTVKLARTLWLIPVVLAAGLLVRSKEARLRIPGFVLAFVAASIVGSLLPTPDAVVALVKTGSRYLLIAALFCMGLDITRNTLKGLSGRPLVLAVGLWILVLPTTLAAVLYWA